MMKIMMINLMITIRSHSVHYSYLALTPPADSSAAYAASGMDTTQCICPGIPVLLPVW